MRLWGEDFTRSELMKRLGDTSQAFGIRRGELTDGPGRGMRTLEVETGGGLCFTVTPDRGMDIPWCRYKGLPVGFVSKVGPVAPGLCRHEGLGFLRGFTAGLLTTCGYTHMGAPSEDAGQRLGQHGPANALPAANTVAEEGWQGDEYALRVAGTMREAVVFGENIQLRREITAMAGSNRLKLTDTVENCGYDTQPLMLLYHFNFGAPLLGPAARLVTSGGSVTARDATAQAGLAGHAGFEPPTHGYAEQVFYHALAPAEGGMAFARLENPALGLAATLRYRPDELPWLVQWKQMGEGDYACGLEPGTWLPEGRAEARRRGELAFIEPGQARVFHLELEVGDC